jgi:DNA-binding beta-propeller fold protein YncE
MSEPMDGRRTQIANILAISIAIGGLILLAWTPNVAASSPRATTPFTKCTVGSGPEFPGYDPINHYMYVPNVGSANISVLRGTCTLVTTIKLPPGAEPYMATFDPQNNHMYVSDINLDQVYDISGTKVVKTITGFSTPWGITFDPGDNYLIVANLNANYVTLVRGTAIWGTITVGLEPGFIGYDPYFATLIVSNFGSDNLTILSALSLAYVGTLDGLCEPQQVVFDVSNDWDYVPNSCGNNVTVIDGTGLTVTSIGGFSTPTGVGFDQATQQVWVANRGVHKADVLNTAGLKISAKEALAASARALGIEYDDYNNDMYVSNELGNDVYIFT